MAFISGGAQHTLGDEIRKIPPAEWDTLAMLNTGNAMYQQAALLENARRATNENTQTLKRVARTETFLAAVIGILTLLTAIDVILHWLGIT